ncbi:hypothetical protein [Methanoculleus sp.]|uniref:hypothetical protein n=1 Tax=Methanoculleus sp. TaxID=90427 RepID=UPI0025F1D150|nr:hypothetical protein [Methanoculleus sp.]
MALYNALYEAAGKLKKAGLENFKSTRDAARATTVAAKQSETVKAAGPALGKVARFAAYPVGLGGGIGLGTWAAGAGAASAIDATGTAFKEGWKPDSIKDAGMMFFGVLLLVMFIAVAVYLYRTVKGA